MNLTILSITMLTLGLALTLSGPVNAQRYEHRRGDMREMEARDDDDMPMRGRMRGGMMPRLIERLTQQLELSDEQQTKVRTLLRSHAKEGIRKRADIAVARLDLQQLLEADTVDMSSVKGALNDIAAKEVDTHLARITAMQDIRKLLTPEQQPQFRSLCGPMIDDDGMVGCGQMGRRNRQMGRGKMMGQGRRTD